MLAQAVRGISDVVMKHGYMNVDFADVKTVMANRGRAVMGTGVGQGEGRAIDAAQKAIASPLLEDGSIKGARAVLINVTGGEDMGIYEFNEASAIIKEEADPSANIIVGVVINPGHERRDHGHGDRDGVRRGRASGSASSSRCASGVHEGRGKTEEAQAGGLRFQERGPRHRLRGPGQAHVPKKAGGLGK